MDLAGAEDVAEEINRAQAQVAAAVPFQVDVANEESVKAMVSCKTDIRR